MTWIIGIDEAGYGPNLGPLCVAATIWKNNSQLAPTATSKAPPIDLYQLLKKSVSPTLHAKRLAIADSKQLYKPKQGLRHLERGVLATLAAATQTETTHWSEYLKNTGADPNNHRHTLPWYTDYNCALPIDSNKKEIKQSTKLFTNACGFADTKLVAVRARIVFPAEFNELTDYYGTKGAALSHVTIGLLRQVLKGDKEFSGSGPRLPSSLTGDVSITCDKHGGRNRYAAILQHHFPDDWIHTICEGRPASRYRFGENEICFRTKGEEKLPVALASMTAKYHRELAMRAFNAFWCEKLPKLKPTAGYPVDAKRFKAEIASVQSKLGIEDHQLWRNR